MQQRVCNIDGLSLPAVQPESAVELSQIICAARRSNEAVYPVGGGTMLSLGLPPVKPGKAVDVRGLSQVVDYPARDMTVTVQAGMTVANLESLLAGENQRLPIDVPRAEKATVGGVLAADTSGLRRFGCGTLRDYLIGITFVNEEGEAINAGGRVVKNVAGYDFCKLHIRALGTLGVIMQATFKVVPRPEQDAILILGCPPDKLEDLLERLHSSATRPVAVEVLNPVAAAYFKPTANVNAEENQWLVVVGLENNAEAVNWQVQQLIMELKTAYSLEARVGDAAASAWKALVEFPAREETTLTFQASTLPSRCADFCRRLSSLPVRLVVQAHAGNGIVVAHLDENVGMEQACEIIDECRRWVAVQGSLVVVKCPSEWKKSISVWGPAPASIKVMRQIKAKLDPSDLFNPGRFLDGI